MTGAHTDDLRPPPAAAALGFDRWLLLILGGAFVLRLGYGLFAGLAEPPAGRPFLIDEQEYYAAGQMLAAGHGFAFYDTWAWTRAPLYPLLVALVFRLAGVGAGPVLVVQAALSTGTLYWLATLAGRVAGPLLSVRAARRGAALVGALWLTPTLFAGLLVSETLFLWLFVGALVLLARWADGATQARPPGGERRAWVLLLAAGAVLGLAALTRSTALAFVPLVAAWAGLVAWRAPAAWAAPPAGARRTPAVKRGLGAVLVVLLGAAGVIAPWTARNVAAYGAGPGGPVLIDTSSGYNLWLAANGVVDGERLAADLRGIGGVLTRQQHALAQAQQLIAADPGAFLAKGARESLDLWRINFTAEERQLGGYTQGRVPAQHLLAVGVLDDGLYLLIVGLALLGLAAAPADPLKGLIALWAALWLVMAFVFFAVTRFRFPVVAVLLPWVPLGAAWLQQAVQHRALPRLRPAGGVALGVLAVFLALVVPSVRADEVARGMQLWEAQAPFRAGEAALSGGNPQAALEHYAAADQALVDTRFGTLAAQLAVVDRGPSQSLESDLQALARSPYLDLKPEAAYRDRMETYVLLGHIARLLGNRQRAATLFTDRVVEDTGEFGLGWAHDHLLFAAVPNQRIDVGSGLDVGLVEGVYGVEQDGDVTYRWSSAVLVPRTWYTGPMGLLVKMRMRVNGWRPAGWPPATLVADSMYCLDACLDQRQVFVVPNDMDWHEVEIDLASLSLSGLRVAVNTFVPGGSDPRSLGVKIDWIEWR